MAEENDEDDTLGQIMASLSECTAQAMTCKKADQPAKAMRLMERAVKLCQGREHSHPALAVEAARARLNLGGLLSWAGRHMEAVDAVKEAQHGLASILAWASDCEPGDPGVDAIATEARSLQCAALVAEAIELEPFAAAGAPPGHPAPERQQRRRGMHEELFREARAIAEEELPPAHPMASLAARLSEECAVCARPAAAAEQPPSGSRAAGSGGKGAAPRAAAAAGGGGGRGPGGLVLPAVREPGSAVRAGGSVGLAPAAEVSSEAPPTPGPPVSDREGAASAQERSLNASGEIGASDVGGMSASSVLQANSDAGGRSGPARRSRPSNAAGAGRAHGRAGSSGGQAKGEKHDVFSDFLRGAELDKEARLGPLQESMQDDVRKRLNQVHRTTRLQLELLDDDELREKRYTRSGHRVFMRNLVRDNGCRSDPNLLSEARKAGETPELAQVKKLYRQLYIPPRTPEPVKVVPKVVPEVEFLKETGAHSFKRSMGFKVPEAF